MGHRPERTALLERLASLGEAEDLRGLWAELGPWLVGPRLAQAARAPLRAAGGLVPPLLLRTDGPAVAAQLRALLALPDSSAENLRQVRIPVLLVQGGRDRLAPSGDTARLLSLLPDTRVVVVPRAGHLPLLRVPTVRGGPPLPRRPRRPRRPRPRDDRRHMTLDRYWWTDSGVVARGGRGGSAAG